MERKNKNTQDELIKDASLVLTDSETSEIIADAINAMRIFNQQKSVGDSGSFTAGYIIGAMEQLKKRKKP